MFENKGENQFLGFQNKASFDPMIDFQGKSVLKPPQKIAYVILGVASEKWLKQFVILMNFSWVVWIYKIFRILKLSLRTFYFIWISIQRNFFVVKKLLIEIVLIAKAFTVCKVFTLNFVIYSELPRSVKYSQVDVFSNFL